MTTVSWPKVLGVREFVRGKGRRLYPPALSVSTCSHVRPLCTIVQAWLLPLARQGKARQGKARQGKGARVRPSACAALRRAALGGRYAAFRLGRSSRATCIVCDRLPDDGRFAAGLWPRWRLSAPPLSALSTGPRQPTSGGAQRSGRAIARRRSESHTYPFDKFCSLLPLRSSTAKHFFHKPS